jgi:hypothetical protein
MMLMKKEVFGKSYERAYRRHCAEKKFKQRARKRQYWFSYDLKKRFETGQSDRKSWGEIWQDLKNGKYGKYLHTTGQPCSCYLCRYPQYEREAKSEVFKKIWKDIQNEAKDSTLGY